MGVDAESGRILVEIDQEYFRPTEVDILLCDYRKAKEKLGWQPEIHFKTLIKEMVKSDLEVIKGENRQHMNTE